MKNKILPIIILVLSVVLAIVSYIILPETVITQITLNSLNPTTMPKIIAILIPFALSTGFSVVSLLQKENSENKTKFLLVAVIGILVYFIMMVMNGVQIG